MKNKLTKKTVISLICAVIFSFSVFDSLEALTSGNIFSFLFFIYYLLFTISFYLIFYILHTGESFKSHIPIIFSLAGVAEICSFTTRLQSDVFANMKLAFFIKLAVAIVTLFILLAAVLKKYDLAVKLFVLKIIAGSAFYIIIFYHDYPQSEMYLRLIFIISFALTSVILVVAQILEALPFIYLIKNEKAEQSNNDTADADESE